MDENGGIAEEQIQKKMLFEIMAHKGYTADWSVARLWVKNAPRLSVKRQKP
ncbi:MAG: hypothetical protein ACRC3H_00285 [Lachnospiraceae bacterium]